MAHEMHTTHHHALHEHTHAHSNAQHASSSSSSDSNNSKQRRTSNASSGDETIGSLAAMWRIVLTRACVLVRVRTEPARRRAAHVVEELLETTPVRGVPAGALDQMERWRAQTESARSRSCSTRARCRAFG